MTYVIERFDRIGDAIWYFPGGIVAMIAIYLIIAYVGRKRPEAGVAEPAATSTPGPQTSRLGCVWTLGAVYVVVWIFLILRA